jgi:hypothetical protein
MFSAYTDALLLKIQFGFKGAFLLGKIPMLSPTQLQFKEF